MRYTIGVIVIIIGSLLVIKSNTFLSWFGRVGFAEKYLGTEGGSRLFYKLLGILIIFLAFFGMTGLLESTLRSIFGTQAILME